MAAIRSFRGMRFKTMIKVTAEDSSFACHFSLFAIAITRLSWRPPPTRASSNSLRERVTENSSPS